MCVFVSARWSKYESWHIVTAATLVQTSVSARWSKHESYDTQWLCLLFYGIFPDCSKGVHCCIYHVIKVWVPWPSEVVSTWFTYSHLTTVWVWTGVSARWSKYESCDTDRLCPLDLLLVGPGDKASRSEFCPALGCDSRSNVAEFRHEFAPEARDSALFTGRSLRCPWANSLSVTAFSCLNKVSDNASKLVKVIPLKT